MSISRHGKVLVLAFALGCGSTAGGTAVPPGPRSEGETPAADPAEPGDASTPRADAGVDASKPKPKADAALDGAASPAPDAADGAPSPCGTPADCALADERKAATKLELVRSDAAALAVFLKAMPKGGDLHNHLSGAVYAETFLGWAKTTGYCVDATSFALVGSGSCANANSRPIPDPGAFYDDIVRAWSMKDFVPSAAESGHDHFFATFGKFGLVSGSKRSEMIADTLARFADENVTYAELMLGFGTSAAGTLGNNVWGTSGTPTAADLPAFHQKFLADPGFAAALNSAKNSLDDTDTKARTAIGCDVSTTSAKCPVTLRYLAQTSRTEAADRLFGTFIIAFELAAQDHRVVGLNLVSPEDNSVSLRDYEIQMAMLGYLYDYYVPTKKSPLRIALHAGELTSALLSSTQQNHLTFHVRRAVEVAHAERIGHAVDILSETDPQGLLAELRAKNVLVEICLASNAIILEVSGQNHPLGSYLQAGVPVALGTDDEGVARSSMTLEHVRAVTAQGLDYVTLKKMARQSLEHSFIAGESVWKTVEPLVPADACAPTPTMGLGDANPVPLCRDFLEKNERARLQWELERRYAVFEKAQ